MNATSGMKRALPFLLLALGCAFLALAFVSVRNPPLFVLSSLAVAAAWAGGGLLLRRAAGCSDHLLVPDAAPSGFLVQSPRHWARAVPPPAVRARPWALAIGLALVTVLAFLAGTWVLLQLPWVSGLIDAAATSASWTPLWLTVLVATLTGWGEELFFRWGLPAVWGRHSDWWALLAYTASTIFTGNAVLVLAAPILGLACAWVYRSTGRVLTACVVHTGFSLGVVGLVPLLLNA